MKIHELLRLDERAPLLNKLANRAKVHYNTTDESEALLLYLARGMMHSEEDDTELKKDVSQLKQKVDQIENKLKAKPQLPKVIAPPKEIVKTPKINQGEFK